MVIAGSGNGQSAQAYDPYDQLRSGWFNNQSFKFWSGANYSNEFKLTADHRNSHGLIEGMLDQSHHITASVDRWNLSEETLLDLRMTYYQQEADLPLLGGNLSNLFSSIYRTPISFDNANGLNKRDAFKNSESYLLTNGAHRSHAPDLSDNPYGLINRLPDGNKLNRWNANLKLSQYFGNYNFELKGAADLQKNKSVFGFPPGYAASANGILTNRDVNQEAYNLNLNQYYRAYISGGKVKLNLFYNYQSTTNQIDRTDFTDFTPSAFPNSEAGALESQINRKLSRQSHELVFSSLLSLDHFLSLNLSSNFYFSNTLNKKEYSNFFPSASLTIDLEDLFDFYIYTLELYVSASKSIKEEGLIYDNWAYRSTDMPVSDYQSFYQSGELFFNDDLSPQLFNKLELGVKTEFDFWDIHLSYFYNTTADFIAPVKTADSYRLANVGNMVDKGFNAQIGFRSYYYGDFQWKSQLSWSLQRNKITSVNSDEPIPLAGFAEVQSQIAQGQPLGAIYGSTYERNEQGQLIIGPDGFPIKNSALSLIGNPIPRFTMGLSNYFRVRRFEFSMTLDSQFGGDRWNGTRAALDYLGRSSETGEDREIRDYVFPGVDANGNPNTIPVNFADPSAAFESNRWVRYGWDGVAEDYIEKASTLRISELSLGYGIRLNNTPINHMKITAVARNLLLYTSYSGVDTNSTLFGYLTGDGLDLFNSPSTKSYALQVTLNF
ncbi:TonB-dependent receptor domain-containing protein [Roseivirga sp.]|uniref:TonB-dependent receptor domain-containing protein n=1 Tax=Roseivirga sp. TaxID=1964215 RepID=UPI003B52F712